MIFDKLEPLYFLLAFGIGLFFCYISKPSPTIVVKFPSPVNAGTVTYKSDDGSCYKFKASKETCPIDSSLIKAQPLSDNQNVH